MKTVRIPLAGAMLATLALMPTPGQAQAVPTFEPALIERGRYLVKITQCNNCHTEGYSASGGTLPVAKWLDGTQRSWVTREGTVHATNLRILVSEIPLQTWIALARNSRARAPMPWWSLRDMNDEDLTAVYAFIRALGPSGVKAPAFVPADPSKPRPPSAALHD